MNEAICDLAAANRLQCFWQSGYEFEDAQAEFFCSVLQFRFVHASGRLAVGPSNRKSQT